MAHSASLLNAKSEFDSFLFAPIGEDKRGTMVSVLTAVARLDLDPWQQAADFARLPKEAAKTRLAAMIATLPGMSSSEIEPRTVAARLIPLLPAPRAAQNTSATWATWLGANQPPSFRSPRYMLSVAVFVALGFGYQLLMARQQPSIDSPQTQASATTHPQAPTPSQGDAASTTGSVMGDVMTNGKKPRDLIDLRGKGGNAALAQPAQQTQASASAQPAATTSPVRRPLFGR